MSNNDHCATPVYVFRGIAMGLMALILISIGSGRGALVAIVYRCHRGAGFTGVVAVGVGCVSHRPQIACRTAGLMPAFDYYSRQAAGFVSLAHIFSNPID